MTQHGTSIEFPYLQDFNRYDREEW